MLVMVAGPFSSHADKSRGAVLRPIQLELLTVRHQPSAENLLLKLANIRRFNLFFVEFRVMSSANPK